MKKLIFICLFLLLPLQARAATYYVASSANGGSDSNDGLSGDDEGGGVGPWETIAKVNVSLSQSDDVYFLCGDTWDMDATNTDRLDHDQSGTSVDRCVIGAYYMNGAVETIGVSGNKPIIDGGVHDTSKPITYPERPSATPNDGLIRVNYDEYVTIENIKVQDSNACGIYMSYADFVNVDNCDAEWISRSGITYTSGSSGSATTRNVISNCTITQHNFDKYQNLAAAAGFAAGGMANSDYVTVKNCILDRGWGEGIGFYRGSDYGIAEDNIVFAQQQTSIYIDACQECIIRRNLVFGTTDTDYHLAASGFCGTGIGNNDEGQCLSWCTWQNNKIYNNLVAFCRYGYSTGAAVNDHIGHDVYNNTFVDCLIGIYFWPGAKSYISGNFKNNLILDVGNDDTLANIDSSTGAINFNYNLWDSESDATDPDSDAQGANDPGYATYNAADTDSVLFKTSGWQSLNAITDIDAIDFEPQTGSDALDVGVNVGSDYNMAIEAANTDFQTVTVATASQDTHTPWEIGAIIDVSGGSPPVEGSFADILFWWRCEGVTLDGSLDHTEGADSVGSLVSGAAINTDAVKYGTNGLDIPTTNDYVEFGVTSGDMISSAEGRLGCWFEFTTWVDNALLFDYRHSDASNAMGVKMLSGDGLYWYWTDNSNGRVALSIVDADLDTPGVWYFLEFAWKTSTNYREIFVNGASKGSSSSTIETFTTDEFCRFGNKSANAADFFIDNIMISNLSATSSRDFYIDTHEGVPLKDVTAYPTDASPTITAIGTATVSGGIVTFTVNRTESDAAVGNPGYYWALQLSEELGPYATPDPSELRWDCGPGSAYADAPYYAHLPDSEGTYHLLYNPNLAVPFRITNPQVYGDGSAALIVNDAVLEDGDSNALATDFSGLGTDFDGTGTIIIAVPKTANEPLIVKPAGGDATTLAGLVTLMNHLVPDDAVVLHWVTEATATVTQSGTSGHPIVFYIPYLSGNFDVNNKEYITVYGGTNRVSGNVLNSGGTGVTLLPYNPVKIVN